MEETDDLPRNEKGDTEFHISVEDRERLRMLNTELSANMISLAYRRFNSEFGIFVSENIAISFMEQFRKTILWSELILPKYSPF
jgi:hypothetical protein